MTYLDFPWQDMYAPRYVLPFRAVVWGALGAIYWTLVTLSWAGVIR